MLTIEDLNAGSPATASDPRDVEECLALGGAYARAMEPPEKLGRTTAAADAAVRLFAEVRAVRAREDGGAEVAEGGGAEVVEAATSVTVSMFFSTADTGFSLVRSRR